MVVKAGLCTQVHLLKRSKRVQLKRSYLEWIAPRIAEESRVDDLDIALAYLLSHIRDGLDPQVNEIVKEYGLEHRILIRHLGLDRMSQKMRFFGPKVHDPSRVAKDAMLKLAREQHRRDVCNARLQDLEKELQMFSEEFSSRFQDLRLSMKDEIHTTSDLKAFSGSRCPDEEKSEGLEFQVQDIEKVH